jgi:hypothetical protein
MYLYIKARKTKIKGINVTPQLDIFFNEVPTKTISITNETIKSGYNSLDGIFVSAWNFMVGFAISFLKIIRLFVLGNITLTNQNLITFS